jgi:LDH2 family malate/lactate/ureidoglycolate dehydrogenase
MKVDVYELKALMEAILKKRRFSNQEAKDIAFQYWDAELRGKRAHGLGKFLVEVAYFSQRKGKPKIVIDKGAVVLVDGNKEVGQLSAQFCVNHVTSLAKQYGVAVVGLLNTQRYGILDTWARMIAERDMVGIVL